MAKKESYVLSLLVTDVGAALLFGRKIFIKFPSDEMMAAVITLMASFYLLDMDYPASWVLPLTVMQRMIFRDRTVFPQCKEDVAKAIADYGKFLN